MSSKISRGGNFKAFLFSSFLASTLLLSGCGGGSSSNSGQTPQITITHNGYTYGVITSPITGKQWLDRNLGAYKICTTSRDDFTDDDAYVANQKNCFGDLYQWGRNADGHQEVIDDTTNTPNKTASFNTIARATSYSDVGHGDFITNTDSISDSDSPFDWLENNTQDTNNIDDNGTLRSAQWSKIDGTSICPVGFRVPTSAELYVETTQYSGTNNETTGAVRVVDRDSAFKNFLRFPVSGARYLDGSLGNQGYYTIVWSSSVNGSNSSLLYFNNRDAYERSGFRGYGFSVRCIKD